MPATKKTAPTKKAAAQAPAATSDTPEDLVIAARPAQRSDTSGQGRTLDAIGNPR